jgi:hypothetical protein
MSPSPEEPATGAGGADTDSVVSDEVRAVAGGTDTGSAVSDNVRAVAGARDAGSAISDEVRSEAGGVDAGSLISDEVRVLAAGADCGGISVSVTGVSLSVGDDVSVVFLDVVCRSRLRKRRHVSELCSEAPALVATAGFAPNASLVSMSSCPVTASPLRTW